jgi:hypothetical protein
MNPPSRNKTKYIDALKSYTNPNAPNSDELKPKASPLQIQRPIQLSKNIQEKNKEKRHQ